MILSWKNLTSDRLNLIRGIIYIAVFVLCAGIYLILNNLLIDMLDIPGTRRTELATDIGARLSYLITHTLPAASSVWISVWGPPVAKLAFLLAGCVILIALLLNGIRDFLIRSAFAIIVLMLSLFTFSVLKDAYLAHRLYAGASAWILFLVWMSIDSIVNRFRPTFSKAVYASGKAILGTGIAFLAVSSMVIPMRYLHALNSAEYRAISSLADQQLSEFPRELDLVLPAPYERTMEEVFWAEFKTRSSHMPWVAPKMVSLAVGEALLGKDWSSFLKSNRSPIDLFYSTASQDSVQRPELDIFGMVHSGNWTWTEHPLFGPCRKVNHLQFYHSPIFGEFDNTGYPYLYHLGLGWIYVAQPDASIAVLMDHGNRECRFDQARFPVLEVKGEFPLLYDPFIGYRARLLPVGNP